MLNILSLPAKPSYKSKPYFSKWDRNLLSLTHELSGPLSAARINFDHYQSTQNATSLDLLNANLKLMEDYLNNARQHIKQPSMPIKNFEVKRQLEDIVKNLQPVALESSVRINLNTGKYCHLSGNPILFKQIISCFIRNALEAYDNTNYEDKTVELSYYLNSGYLVVSIGDHGSGIAETDKAEIFKPYYSTKRSKSGLGLGLSLATESLTEDFNGKVEVDSLKSNGSVFRLFFQL